MENSLLSLIYDYIYIPILFFANYFRDLKKFELIYGKFSRLNKREFNSLTLHYANNSNVTGLLVGEIVLFIDNLKVKPKSVLMAGESIGLTIEKQYLRNFHIIILYAKTKG